jgi:hypothetical protein
MIQMIVPDDVFDIFMQHLRDFVSRQPGQVFEVWISNADSPGNSMSADEAVEIVKESGYQISTEKLTKQ